MSELRPLLEEDSTSVEADILRHARARQPSPGAAARAIVVLGVAGAATTATAGVAAAPVAALVAKWAGVGALSAVLVIGGGQLAKVATGRSSALVSSGRVEPARQTPTRVSSRETPAPVAAPLVDDVQVPPAPTESVAVQAQPLAAPRPAMRAPITAQDSEPSTPAVLDAEIALLDAARDAVAAHDANRALRLLDDHRVQFPNGQLSQEATYVRVKALLERGSRAEAEQTARQFLQAHPESPHAKRIRALFDP